MGGPKKYADLILEWSLAAPGVEPQVALQLHTVHRFGFWVAVRFSDEQQFKLSNLTTILTFYFLFQNQNFKNEFKGAKQILPGGIQFCVIFQLLIKVFCLEIQLKYNNKLGPSWQKLFDPFILF